MVDPRVIMDSVRDEHAARLSQCFQASRDVHPIAKEVPVLLDDVPNVYSDPELDAALIVDTCAALSHAGLDLQGATHRVDGARELDEKPISGVLEHPPVVGRNGGIEQLAPDAIEPIKRALFVGTD
jgi:hypothetical protein